MEHEPRLTKALRTLLQEHRICSLGTLDGQGQAFVSMVPFAPDLEQGTLVIHVSQLAAHTANMQRDHRVSLLVTQAEVAGQPVHDLPRVTLQGQASVLQPGTPQADSARKAYLQRFAEAGPMTQLGDFRFVSVAISSARHIAGFGAARTLSEAELQLVLTTPWPDAIQ